jgi:lipopolysaccharide biosynthesis protein
MRPLSDFSIQRAAVFAHFDIDNKVDDYVIFYLTKIKEVCACIIFVTTSALPEKETLKISNVCERVIVRENEGHDFMSYKKGLAELKMENYDEILLCNDSVYGPFFSIKNAFGKMQGMANDFWGMTENYDLAYHLQSYFMVFRKKVIQSSYFKEFWEKVSVENDKSAVIKKYEVGLTQFLIKAGFIPEAYIRIKSSFLNTLRAKTAFLSIKSCTDVINKLRRLISGKLGINPTHFYWKTLITEYNMPFIKIDILRDNFKNINIEDYMHVLNTYSDYDTGLIQRHLERVKGRYTVK